MVESFCLGLEGRKVVKQIQKSIRAIENHQGPKLFVFNLHKCDVCTKKRKLIGPKKMQ